MEQPKITEMLRKGTVLHGNYRIEEHLASGGFGNTYRVTHTELGETFAIKEFYMKGVSERGEDSTTVKVSNALNKSQFESQRTKFKKEALRLRQLRDPHIVSVHDLFDENGTSYYVMDFIDGHSLSTHLKQTGKPMPEERMWKMLPQILQALETVHANHFQHLDLKPANIMMDGAGNVTLIDFGASKLLDKSGGSSTSSALAYTPGFAPREQMEQNLGKLGPWTDLYALGATLYNLVTCEEPPLPSDIDDEHEQAFFFPGHVSERMKRLILWMMTQNRRERPQSAAEVREWLCGSGTQEVQSNTVMPKKKTASEETILLTPPAQTEREKLPPNPWRRHALMALAAVGIMFVAFFSWHFVLGGGDEEEPVTLIEEPESPIETFTANGVSFKMVRVEGGTFQMGSNSGESGERPVHEVTVSSFLIGETEVTQELWEAVMGSNPSWFKGSKLPVECVSWEDICGEDGRGTSPSCFLYRLNQLTGENFRLPTEAEWEYAARGGNKSNGYIYSGGDTLGVVAWYYENSGSTTHEVATKSPNELGIYDMSGNVYEWCQDWYGSDYYSSSPSSNPTGPSSGSYRVGRGGSWGSSATDCRVADRYNNSPSYSYYDLGLRLAQ